MGSYLAFKEYSGSVSVEYKYAMDEDYVVKIETVGDLISSEVLSRRESPTDLLALFNKYCGMEG
jgi:hypothetical protein